MAGEIVKLLAVNRHRITIDGEGVTTLVALRECPLKCKYCINDDCHLDAENSLKNDASGIVQDCMKDNLYFLATKGGITVGGGEPLLHPQFIKELREKMPEGWRLNLETSLNVPLKNVEEIADGISFWFIDIKDMNPDIYKAYTECNNRHVMENLKYLVDQGYSEKCRIRIPLIPSYNTDEDRDRSVEQLKEMGFSDFDRFNYVVRKN